MTTPAGLRRIEKLLRDKNWIYAGGEPRKGNQYHYNYWVLFYTGKGWCSRTPTWVNHCICDHKILFNCWIFNTETKRMKVLGNCCIKKFGLDGRRCQVCNEKHKNRKDNLCNDCRDRCRLCNSQHKNKNDKLCNSCRNTRCITCDKTIDEKYNRCYKCNIKNKKLFN